MELENEQKCFCGGEVDCLYKIEPQVWQGRCFVCGAKHTVIKLKEEEHGSN